MYKGLWYKGLFVCFPGGFVLADSFFLIFIFVGKVGWLGGRLPGVYLCAVF